jgi:hypothetical protein
MTMKILLLMMMKNNATSPPDEEQHIITTTPTTNTTNSHDTTTTNAHENYFMHDKRIIRRPSRCTEEVIVAVLQQLQILPTAMNLTIKQALKKFDKRARGAIQAELRQLITKRVWNAIMRKKDASSKSKHSNILPSSMFLKEKFNANNGLFDKLKARLVAGGHRVRK